MPRLMSVALTEQAVIERRKTVTRRLGWKMIKPGDQLQLVRKAMGRKCADGSVEPLVRLALVEVVSARREHLDNITDSDVVLEGFPDWIGYEFVDFFVAHVKCRRDEPVTRIEWRYL